MSNPAIEIPNVLYRYGMCIDEAKFAEAAASFDMGILLWVKTCKLATLTKLRHCGARW